MTDTTHCIPDDVLERAARFSLESGDRNDLADRLNCMYGDVWAEIPEEVILDERDVLRAALPIQIPAIETALLERLQSYADDAELECDPGTWEPIALADWLAKFLPVAEGESK